jgi:radical SAM superfamily enzyme YgiQ (UPF0313 family)
MHARAVAAPGRVVLVQLPFPSQSAPEPVLARYYEVYDALYRRAFPNYRTNAGDLWEAPLWVAHLDGAIGRDDTTFLDLSRAPYDAEACLQRIVQAHPRSTIIAFSPLAQNLRLTLEVSRALKQAEYRTVIGGNMSGLADPDATSVVYSGLLRGAPWADVIKADGHQRHATMAGRQQAPLGYRPRFRLLQPFADRVPLIRINASHGCLFSCTFCGDAWTSQLHVVPRVDLQAEFDELLDIFPNASMVYVGDKTFGQSREAVENLLAVAATARRRLRYVVQTHVEVVSPWLLDAMEALGVGSVELGFESGSHDVLRQIKKGAGQDSFRRALAMLRARGLPVILNVLGGLPSETDDSYARTAATLRETAPDVFLYNLYNFVPYPMTPLFGSLRSRIVDWNFDHWREDAMVVYEPYHLSREASWQWFLEEVRTCTDLCELRLRSEEVVDA